MLAGPPTVDPDPVGHDPLGDPGVGVIVPECHGVKGWLHGSAVDGGWVAHQIQGGFLKTVSEKGTLESESNKF